MKFIDLSRLEIYFGQYEKNGKRIPIRRPMGQNEKELSDLIDKHIAPRASSERSLKATKAQLRGV